MSRKCLLLIFSLFLSVCIDGIVEGQEEHLIVKSTPDKVVAYMGFPTYIPKVDKENPPRRSEEVSFELDGGLIILKAKVDGMEGDFILDSGAPGLIINDINSDEQNEVMIESTMGSFRARPQTLRAFSWSNQNYQNVPALFMDLSYLEKITDRKIKGIVGTDFLSGRELFIDYENKKLKLNFENHPAQTLNALASFSLTFRDHLPIIEVLIEGKKFRFGVDTGAEINVIDKKSFHALFPDNKGSKHQESFQVPVTEIDRVKYRDMRYMVKDLELINADQQLKIDGLLGFPFLSSCIFSIDFQNQELKLWAIH